MSQVKLTKINKSITKPCLVQVILKKDIYKPRSAWWCPEKNCDTYYSSFLNKKQYIYSFLDMSSCHRCYSFLEKYKQINGVYPDLHINKKPSKQQEEGDIYIENDTIDSLKERCKLNRIGLIGITHFNYTHYATFLGKSDVFNLTISAIDLLENSQETINEIDHLNYLLDF